MKIKFIAGPKTGTIEHLDNQTGKTLIASGFAEEVHYKNHVEFLNDQEALRQSTLPKVNTEVVWQVRRLPSEKIIVARVHLGETRYFEPSIYTSDGYIDQKRTAQIFSEILTEYGCPKETIDRWVAVFRQPQHNAAADRAAIDKETRDNLMERERAKTYRRY
jgi:hypothetical protein